VYVLLLGDGTCCELEGTRIIFVPSTVPRTETGDWVEKNQGDAIPLNIIDTPELAEDDGDLVLGCVFNEDETGIKRGVIHSVHAEM
jgi:hypothetical protein